jgi:hypothetical protein
LRTQRLTKRNRRREKGKGQDRGGAVRGLLKTFEIVKL